MINGLLAVALAVLAAFALADARALRRLHRHCLTLECKAQRDRGLLRWYAQGFEAPVQLAQWLVHASALLLTIALLTHAHPALIGASAVVFAATLYARRHGTLWHRSHQLAVRSDESTRPPP